MADPVSDHAIDNHQGGGASAPPPAVVVRGVVKRYGALAACDGVDFVMSPGRIHGVLGQNGAGKSTLMKILIGLVTPDEGSISVNGRDVRITSPQVASDLGIGMVHQHFSLVDGLSVWENVVLGEKTRLDRSAARTRVREIGERYGLEVDPDARVSSLTAGQRQRVEIIKCLRRDPKILIFDEPTSVLTPEESHHLFGVLRNVVKAEGRTVALVSHKLDEVLRATDDVMIMRDGKVVANHHTHGTDRQALADAMVGRAVTLRSGTPGRVPGGADGETPDSDVAAQDNAVVPALEIIGATVSSRAAGVQLADMSLKVMPGEIVGIAGVEGNGQRVLADVLSSLTPLNFGTVKVNGVEVPTGKPGAMSRAGIGVIPEDRHDSGCVLDMSVAENLILADQSDASHRGFLDRDRITARAEELVREFGVSCSSVDAPMWTLSGGNQQRVVLARELSTGPSVLVAAQPTRGLDVGAIEYMGARLRETAASGVGVLLISSELEELVELSDRILVIYRGMIVGEMPGSEVDFGRLGLLMGGGE